ncbi:hypothetical protein ACS0TY_018934 [Phlomoides rotata]
MTNSIVSDNQNEGYFSQPRGFLTPQPPWKTSKSFPATARSETKPRRTPDRFHVIHKIPSGDSPYVRAKHVQLVDKDPSRAISLFWAAINSGDRVDSALKDMAIVMKQLDRSDEAIEAIKSFRHLSPIESQESLDNILVELYKQSGRIEEEIEMLQRKLKQVEGIALSGTRTKIARSQGKKVQITVEKDYSRLLGNLAWAYMQNKDFKSAEEYYRKALSIESDKNKQCNLAICLMHMNKLTEAKFLLQTVRFSSGNDCVEEPYAKSYERASQILAEFELKEETEQVNRVKPFGGQWGDGRFCSQKKSDDKTISGAFTEVPYEKRTDFGWRRNHCEPREEAYSAHCYGNIPKVPFTQPRRGGDQRKGRSKENAYCRKLSFGTSTGNEQSFVNQNVNYYSEMQNGGDWRRNSSSIKPLEDNDCHKSATDLPADAEHEENLSLLQAVCVKTREKSWADIVEEDELEFGCWKNDENVDSNINHETPKPELCLKMELMDFGSGYLTQPEKTVKRSLHFDNDHNDPNLPNDHYTPEVLSQEEGLSEDLSCSSSQRRRLKVFQDITSSCGT